MTFGIILAPSIVLSLLNRFLFGKIVCVMTDRGIHLENDFVTWGEIQKVTYVPDIISRTRMNFSRAYISVKRSSGEVFDIEVNHFPVYGLRKMKKFAPQLKIVFVKKILWLALIPTIMGLVFGILG